MDSTQFCTALQLWAHLNCLYLLLLWELTGSEPGPVQGQHSNSCCLVSQQEECLSDKPLLCAKASTITEKALGFSNNVAPDDYEMRLSLRDGRGVKDTQSTYCGYVKSEINSVILSIDRKIIPCEYNNNPCKTMHGSYISVGHQIFWSLRHVAAERLEN